MPSATHSIPTGRDKNSIPLLWGITHVWPRAELSRHQGLSLSLPSARTVGPVRTYSWGSKSEPALRAGGKNLGQPLGFRGVTTVKMTYTEKEPSWGPLPSLSPGKRLGALPTS